MLRTLKRDMKILRTPKHISIYEHFNVQNQNIMNEEQN